MRCTLVLIEPKVLHHNENVTIDIAKNWQIPAYKYITLLTKNIFVYIAMYKFIHKIKLCSSRYWFQSFVTLVSRIMYYLMFLVLPKSSLLTLTLCTYIPDTGFKDYVQWLLLPYAGNSYHIVKWLFVYSI